jgi:hypothetical protein
VVRSNDAKKCNPRNRYSQSEDVVLATANYNQVSDSHEQAVICPCARLTRSNRLNIAQTIERQNDIRCHRVYIIHISSPFSSGTSCKERSEALAILTSEITQTFDAAHLEGLAVRHGLRRIVDDQLSSHEDDERGDGSRRRLSVGSGDLVLNLLERKGLWKRRNSFEHLYFDTACQYEIHTLSLAMIAVLPMICSPSQLSIEFSL